jgi:hypothetical protein
LSAGTRHDKGDQRLSEQIMLTEADLAADWSPGTPTHWAEPDERDGSDDGDDCSAALPTGAVEPAHFVNDAGVHLYAMALVYSSAADASGSGRTETDEECLARSSRAFHEDSLLDDQH